MESAVETITLRDGQLFLIICKEPNLSNYVAAAQKKTLKAKLVMENSSVPYEILIKYYLETVAPSGNKKLSNVHLKVNLGQIMTNITAVPDIFAAMDGVRQPMLHSTTIQGENNWNTAWKNYVTHCCNGQFPSCRNCGSKFDSAVVFEILIDCDPTGEIIRRPGQRAVLKQMKKLLNDRTLTDVTFKFPGINMIE